MNLKEDLLRGIFAYGFEKPSAIQQRAIMPVIKGKFWIFFAYTLNQSSFVSPLYIHSRRRGVYMRVK